MQKKLSYSYYGVYVDWEILFYPLALISLAKILSFHSNLLPVQCMFLIKYYVINDIIYWAWEFVTWTACVKNYLLGDIFYYALIFYRLALRILVKMSYFYSRQVPGQLIYFIKWNVLNDMKYRICTLTTWTTCIVVYLVGDIFWFEKVFFR